MRIKIDGFESPHVLRALAALLTKLADEPRDTCVGLGEYLKADPIPLTSGDASTQFTPADPGQQNEFPDEGPEQTTKAEPAKRTRRTRAQIAADKLAAAPAGGEQLPLGMPTPEVPTAPLAPTAPAAAVVPAAPTAPVTSVPVVPTIASSGATTDVDAPTTFPTLMRALSPLLSGKKLTADALNQACATAGCTNLQGLLQKQELVPQVYALAIAAVSA